MLPTSLNEKIAKTCIKRQKLLSFSAYFVLSKVWIHWCGNCGLCSQPLSRCTEFIASWKWANIVGVRSLGEGGQGSLQPHIYCESLGRRIVGFPAWEPQPSSKPASLCTLTKDKGPKLVTVAWMNPSLDLAWGSGFIGVRLGWNFITTLRSNANSPNLGTVCWNQTTKVSVGRGR